MEGLWILLGGALGVTTFWTVQETTYAIIRRRIMHGTPAERRGKRVIGQ